MLRNFLRDYPRFKNNQHKEKNYGIIAKINGGTIVKFKGECVDIIKPLEIDKLIIKYENKIKDCPIMNSYM